MYDHFDFKRSTFPSIKIWFVETKLKQEDHLWSFSETHIYEDLSRAMPGNVDKKDNIGQILRIYDWHFYTKFYVGNKAGKSQG